jgi:tetratricopeptide (TPR) repeat protein
LERQAERAESAEAAYAQGVEAARCKDREAALTHFTQTLRLDPGHQAARLGLASLLANAGRDAEALAVLREIVNRDNLAGPAYYLLGALAHRAKRYDEALEAFRRALYVEPTLVLAYVERAGVYRALGQTAKAVRELQNAMRALEGAPDEEPVRLSEDLTCRYLRTACARQLEGLTGSATETTKSRR